MPERSIAIAHQKGGVGKTTTTILLAAELADAWPALRIVLEDQDPDRHLTTMLPDDDSAPFELDQLGATQGDVRLIDTGPGDLSQLRTILRHVDYVIVPVRLETMTLQALNKFLPVVEDVQQMRGGAPELLGFVVTHYAARSVEHQRSLAEVQHFAASLGTRILAVVPFSPRIGMRITTQGHYYRPAAEAVLEVLRAGSLVAT
ncbi:MAG: ParA family protein [Chloroflexi bacterium]|nr:ParA family protein [Chloroflexota bacterium]